jgi:hypothetical protein
MEGTERQTGTKRDEDHEVPGHVMLSYNWADQKIVLQVKISSEENGL